MSKNGLVGLFRALGDPTRLEIFRLLRCCSRGGVGVDVGPSGELAPVGALAVGDVCCRIGGSLSAVSHHLRELRLAGLIRMEKRGRWIYCSVNPDALDQIRGFLDENVSCAIGDSQETSKCC